LAINDVAPALHRQLRLQLPIGKGNRFILKTRCSTGLWAMAGHASPPFQNGCISISTAGDIANVAPGGQRANATDTGAESKSTENGLLD